MLVDLTNPSQDDQKVWMGKKNEKIMADKSQKSLEWNAVALPIKVTRHPVSWTQYRDMNLMDLGLVEHEHKVYVYTVEQEIFTTGKFREFKASGVSRQGNFANFWILELQGFPTVVLDWKSEHFQAS